MITFSNLRLQFFVCFLLAAASVGAAQQLPPRAQVLRAPLAFEPFGSRGAHAEIFAARGPGYGVYVGRATLAVLGLTAKRSGGPATVYSTTIELVGASERGQLVGAGRLPGYSNYLLGRSAAAFRLRVPHFREVSAPDIYPGVSTSVHGSPLNLEFDFTIAAGRSPAKIQLRVQGAALSLSKLGALLIRSRGGLLTLEPPRAYQIRGKERTAVPVEFRMVDRDSFGFAVGSYDHSIPLVIDPIVAYASFLGGSVWGDTASAVATDASGNAYVVGATFSTDFPVTAGAIQSKCGNGCELERSDAFITKVSPDGSTLIYSTYLGGSSSDEATSVAVDPAGNAYIGGGTASADFPVTSGAVQTTCSSCAGFTPPGSVAGFVAKLNSTGTGLVYSTYLGSGGAGDEVTAIAADSAGDAYAAGDDRTFTATSGAYHAVGATGTYVAKLSPDGSEFLYALQFGGWGAPVGIAVGADGSAYLVGSAQSVPTTPGAYGQTCHSPSFDAFIAKFSPDGSTLDYSTCIGGSSDDLGYGIAVDAEGNAWIAGRTESSDFPVSANAFQPKCGSCLLGGVNDGFVAEISADGSKLLYSSFWGGSADDQAGSIGIGPNGKIWIAGGTASPDFPLTANLALPPTKNATEGAVAELSASGALLLSTPFPSGFIYGIAPSSDGGAYIAGSASPNLPATTGVFESTPPAASSSGFIAKIGTPRASISPASLTFPDQAVATTSGTTNIQIASLGSAPLTISSIKATGDFGFKSGCGSVLAEGASCSVGITFSPNSAGSLKGTVQIITNGLPSETDVSLAGIATPGAQTIDFPAPVPIEYGGTVDLAATATSGLAINYKVISGQAELNGAALTATGIGSVTVEADQPGNATYIAAPAVRQTFTIDPAVLTITANSASMPYGSALPTLTASISGFVNGDTAATATSGTPALSTTATATSPVGQYPITVARGTLAAANYAFTFAPAATLTIVKADQSITFPAIPSQMVGAQPVALDATASSGLQVTFSVISGPATLSGSSLTLTGIGTVIVEADQPGNGNYNPAAAVRQSFVVTPLLAVTTKPTSLAFGLQVYKTTSAAQIVTLTNTGQAAVVVSGVAATGDFAATTDCTSIAVGATCPVSVTFTPTAPGARSGTLSVTDDAGGSPQTAALGGTGSDLSMSPASDSSASATVSAGQTAEYQLSATPYQGLAGGFTLSCKGAPQGATCTPNPATLNLDGSTPVPVTVSVTTTASSLFPALDLGTERPFGPQPWLLFASLGALLFFLTSRSWPRGSLRRALAGAALFAELVLLAACGGSPAAVVKPPPQTNPNATPPGTYALVVSTTDAKGGVVGVASLTLTVH